MSASETAYPDNARRWQLLLQDMVTKVFVESEDNCTLILGKTQDTSV